MFAEYVEVAKRHRLQPVHRREHSAVLLRRELRHRVGGERHRCLPLGPGEAGRVAVYGGRGGEHDAPDALVTRREKNVQCPTDVDLARRDRILHRARYRRQRSLMEDDLAPADGVVDALVASQIALDQLNLVLDAREVVAVAGREVVEDPDLVTAGEQFLNEVRADEARPTCDEDAHGSARIAAGRRRLAGPRSALGRALAARLAGRTAVDIFTVAMIHVTLRRAEAAQRPLAPRSDSVEVSS